MSLTFPVFNSSTFAVSDSINSAPTPLRPLPHILSQPAYPDSIPPIPERGHVSDGRGKHVCRDGGY